ncbi:MAG: hypothetical protein SFW35_08255 [Chitinophagales bacterium]|nr:hypothetical protein [Chitinophagales bacterium]
MMVFMGCKKDNDTPLVAIMCTGNYAVTDTVISIYAHPYGGGGYIDTFYRNYNMFIAPLSNKSDSIFIENFDNTGESVVGLAADTTIFVDFTSIYDLLLPRLNRNGDTINIQLSYSHHGIYSKYVVGKAVKMY